MRFKNRRAIAVTFPTMTPMNPRYRRHAQAVLGVAILVAGLLATPAYAAEEPKQEQDPRPAKPHQPVSGPGKNSPKRRTA